VAQLIVLGGLASFGPLSLDLYLPALPRVGVSLGASASVTQLSVSGCLLGLAAGQFIFGPLGDRFGRRRPLLFGVSVWTLSALLCAIAPNVGLFVALRVIQGFGGAAGLVLGRAVVRDLYERQALARAFAIVALLSNVTPAVAPVAGGGLLQIMSWRGLFLVLTGVGMALVAGVVVFLPESLPRERRHAGGVRETTALARSLLYDRSFRAAAGTLTLASGMLFTYLSLSSEVLQHEYGLSAGAFSLVFAANSVGIILTGSAAVHLLRRARPERLLMISLLAAALSTVALCLIALAGAPLWAVLIALFASISTVGMTFPTATTLALSGEHAAGAGSALLGGTQYAIGGLAGPVVSVAGETMLAMSVAMASFALGAGALARLPQTPTD
jgi:DHA1 family bicyclomycin/chloramphenicol resistance-like MFS transporter